MGTVLVTGGTGFIGHHLVRRLLAGGEKVRCIVRPTSKSEDLRACGAELVLGDMSDWNSLEKAVCGVDSVYHLAGLTSSLSADAMMEVNGRGCQYVAQAFGRQPCPPTMVLVSSVAAAGNVGRGRLKSESDPSTPSSNYGRSKRAGELAALPYADRIPLTIMRPGIVFGPGDRDLLPAFQLIDRFGVHITVGVQSPSLPLIHVDDVVDVMIQAAARGRRVGERGPKNANLDAATGFYFVAGDEHPDYRQLGIAMARALGREHLFVVQLPVAVSWLAAVVGEAIARIRHKQAPFNLDKMREATAPSWACDSSAAQRDLALRPTKSIAERLRETVAWYREHKWLGRSEIGDWRLAIGD